MAIGRAVRALQGVPPFGRLVWALALLVLLPACKPASHTGPSSSRVTLKSPTPSLTITEETVFVVDCQFDENRVWEYPVFSPNARRYMAAYYSGKPDTKGTCRVMIDSVPEGPFDYFASGTFSPSGRHYAYHAGELVETGHPHTVRADAPALVWRVVADGVMHANRYETVEALTYSPDSRHLAYIGRRQNAHYIVLDGVEIQRDQEGGGFRHLVNDGWGSKRPRALAELYPKLTFSPDSKFLAFGNRLGGDLGPIDTWRELANVVNCDTRLLCNDEAAYSPPFIVSEYINESERIRHGSWANRAAVQMLRRFSALDALRGYWSSAPVFSPDGNNAAFRVVNKADLQGGYSLYVNGKISNVRWPDISLSSITFSPNSRNVAFFARMEDPRAGSSQERRGWVVVLNDRVVGEYSPKDYWRQGEDLFWLSFMPDSTALVFPTTDGISDTSGRTYGNYNAITLPVFSADFRHLAFGAVGSGVGRYSGSFIGCVIKDGAVQQPFVLMRPNSSGQGEVLFNHAGTHVAFRSFEVDAHFPKRRSGWDVTLDGHVLPMNYDSVSPLFFERDNLLVFAATRRAPCRSDKGRYEKHFMRIEVAIADSSH